MVLNQFNTNFWDSRNLFDKFHNRELGHFVVKVSFSIGSNTTTAKSTKTSLKKEIHVLSISIAIFPARLLCQMEVNSFRVAVNSKESYPSSEIERNFHRRLFTSSTKREITHLQVVVAQ